MIKQGINWLKNAKFHGLNPKEFNVYALDSCFGKLNKDSPNFIKTYALLDIQLTSAIKECGHRIRYSSLNPKEFHSGWNFPQPTVLAADSVWIQMIRQGDINALNHYFEPNHKLYVELRKELRRCMCNNSVFADEKINYPGFVLQKGDSNRYVLPLKRKLLPVIPDSVVTMAFNAELEEAVVLFQQKHGLTPDGKVGKQTYQFLKWNKQRYIHAIKVNMERLRWLPDSTLMSGMVVNIPSQKANLFHHDSLIFSSEVIVGKLKTKTRVFSAAIDYLVFNPCWTVPKSIATTTILRGLKRDSCYLQKRNMFLCKNGIRVANENLDFSIYTKSYFPFQVFQNTDPGNALGKVKFMFDNRFNIYLHDTPQKSLFNKDVRLFSHGCIRIKNALPLSSVVLAQVDKQNISIQNKLNKGYPVKVYLNNQIPIHILYLTCWINEDTGKLVFGKDVYSMDYRVMELIK